MILTLLAFVLSGFGFFGTYAMPAAQGAEEDTLYFGYVEHFLFCENEHIIQVPDGKGGLLNYCQIDTSLVD